MLGSGLLNIYPPEHESLARDVAQSGCLLSEAPPRMIPISGAFPQRNRIISGLSVGTIVVEATDRSGALITARHAYEQGREVFTVPGPIDSRLSRGCHALIKDGAKLVETIDDVLAELGPLAENVKRDDGPSSPSRPSCCLTTSSSKCCKRLIANQFPSTRWPRPASYQLIGFFPRSACSKCAGWYDV